MKTRKLTIEAQQVCLEAAKEVLNYLEIVFSDFENDGLFREEPVLILKPYNDGYLIGVEAAYDWNKMAELNVPRFGNMFIQPCTFFEAYEEEGQAYVEYGLPFETEEGRCTGRENIITLDTIQGVKAVARKWREKIVAQVESI